MHNNLKNYLANLSHPDKVFFTNLQISKEKLAKFYYEIKDWILPHIVNRPITLLRCPDGINKPCFFQKHPTESLSPSIEHFNYKYRGKVLPYLFIKDFAGLLALVQLGALEIHIWSCKIHNLFHPDQLIFDLDPDKNFSFSELIEGANVLYEYLQKMKLKSFLKTTGRRGLNIVIPLAQKNDSDEVLQFARSVAESLSGKYPNLFVANMRKSARKGRIYIDYLRNAHAATFIAPYSTRATNNAGIATPIAWDELNSLKSGDYYNFINLPIRLKKLKSDPWKNFFNIKQSLP